MPKKKKRRDSLVPATLRKWRRSNHGRALESEYTQGHVAAACGVALRTVQSWEQGHRKPGPTVDRDRLAEAYGVTVAAVDSLLGGGNGR